MKIRSGFVSNSSSSSFLITYKDIADFDLFKNFKGYDRLIKDLKKSTAEDGKEFLKSYVRADLWHLMDDFEYHTDFDNTFERHCALWDLEELGQYHINTDYQEGIRVEGNKLWAEMEAAFPEEWNRFFCGGMDLQLLSGEAIEKWLQLRKKFTSTVEQDEFWNKASEAAEAEGLKLYKALVDKGYKVRAVRYEDDTNEGSYMEHQFMPFLAMSPEGNFWILKVSEH